ncbi:MAG TPA: universal stress protein, partial [Longimicrobiaceae bacterium]|nr:universal stress protein [Longimicrobiaceae bacterium]
MDGRILVATDGSDGALGALRVAAALAERDGGVPLAVSVVEPIVLESSVLYTMPALALALAEQPEVEVRDRVRAQLRGLGLRTSAWELQVPVGPVASEIARLADECDAALIVLGLRRHSRIERFLSGDTAADVARLSRVPVLAVSPDATALPQRAVVGVDFSDYSRDAACTVMEVVAEDADVHLVHVSWIMSHDDGDDDWASVYRTGARVRLEELAHE